MLGESFLSFIQGKSKTIHDKNYVYCLVHYGVCLLIKGDWKITNISNPFKESSFALYNLAEDWGESKDLSKSNPEKFKEMINEWQIFKKKSGIIPLDDGEVVQQYVK